MSTLEALEARIRELPRDQVFELQDWLTDYVEDELELTEEFVASIERGKTEIASGKRRTHKP